MCVFDFNRACVAGGDGLYVIGGQEGDFMPKPGSPIFKCSRRHEVPSFLYLHEKSLLSSAKTCNLESNSF